MAKMKYRLSWVGSCLAMLLLMGAALARLLLQNNAEQEAHAVTALKQDLDALKANAALVAPNQSGLLLRRLTTGLPKTEPLIDNIQHAASSHGVLVTTVSINNVQSTMQTLGHVDVALTLHGAYANLVTVLEQTRAQYPALVMQHWSVRRMTTPLDLEAQWALQLMMPPLNTVPVAR